MVRLSSRGDIFRTLALFRYDIGRRKPMNALLPWFATFCFGVGVFLVGLRFKAIDKKRRQKDASRKTIQQIIEQGPAVKQSQGAAASASALTQQGQPWANVH
jgi:hypothetical protein